MKQTPLFQELMAHAHRFKTARQHALDLSDATRFSQLQFEFEGVFIDCAKQLLTPSILKKLLQFAEENQLKQSIDDLYSGALVNFTEQLPALHTALRAMPDELKHLNHDGVAEIFATLKEVQAFAASVRSGDYRPSGRAISHVINLGIGGSDLGPRFVCDALFQQDAPLRCTFVSNADSQDFINAVSQLDPAQTLVIASSKSFKTCETLINLERARQWFLNAGLAFEAHCVGVTAFPERAKALGIQTIFPIWPWVGGRYSVWSSIGLPILLQMGETDFAELLAGARLLDQHFQTAPFENNIAVILGLIDVWNASFLNAHTQAVLPYSERLKYLPDYLQQLFMESNGKSWTREDNAITYATAPVWWGKLGSHGQHAFHQLLLQGTQLIPCEFVTHAKSLLSDEENAHHFLLANCFAQSEVMLVGTKKERSLESFRQLPGGQPSTVIVLSELTAKQLGILMALYEHRAYVQSVIWRINAFDQHGVEAGKTLAQDLLPCFSHADDAATAPVLSRRLIEFVKAQ